MLIEKITIDDIEIGLQTNDWEDAIRKSSKRLLEKGSIDQSYVEAMINVLKETGPYIVLAKHIALAHTRPECGANELGLSFTTLSPPIRFGSESFDPIKLIITLSATDSHSHLDLMAELANILIDPERVDALLKAQTKEEFYKVLIELDK